jgi:hypothetical protein
MVKAAVRAARPSNPVGRPRCPARTWSSNPQGVGLLGAEHCGSVGDVNEAAHDRLRKDHIVEIVVVGGSNHQLRDADAS